MGKNGGRQTLSKEMLEAIAEKAAEIAAAVATNTYQQKVKEEEKAKFDKRYKNTKLLLEHYRDFSDYGERAIYRIYGLLRYKPKEHMITSARVSAN